MGPLGLILIVAIAGLGIYLYRRAPRQRVRKQVRALLLACRGDQELVERLIFAELQRADVSYDEAARRALARLIRDRR